MTKKYQLQKKIQGSISLLLVIILLPMMTFSAIIVDMSRVNMARQMLSSAGDLTMNTALANYDTILKDVYGLFAMSQQKGMDNKALGEALNTYFAKTLSSYGVVSEEESDDYVKELIGDFCAILEGGTTDTANFLEMTDINLTATKVPNSALSEPSVLRRQIVEYMKYRAPLGVGLSFLDSLTAFEKVNDQNTVVEAQVKAQESTQDVTQACKKLIKLIREYDKRVTEINGALAGVTSTTDKTVVPLEDYDSHPMKYLSSWHQNYTHINKLNLVFQANPPSADSVYLKSLDYVGGERFVDRYGVMYSGKNPTGIPGPGSLAGDYTSAQQQVMNQITNLNNNYAQYQALYAKPILHSSLLTLTRGNNMDYCTITVENEEAAINSFISFEQFLLDQSANGSITYSQTKTVLEQVNILGQYLKNFMDKINAVIETKTKERDTAYKTWQGHLKDKNTASGKMNTQITNINSKISAYLTDNEEAFSCLGSNTGNVKSVISALPGRNVGYESYYNSYIKSGESDKYIECFKWVVNSSGLGGSVITETQKYISSKGYDASDYQSYVGGKLSAEAKESDLFKLLCVLKACHSYAVTYKNNIAPYNTASTKEANSKADYQAKAKVVSDLETTRNTVQTQAKGCLQGYHTFCTNFQADAYYYKYYMVAAKNVIEPEAQAIQTQFAQLVAYLEELRGDLNEIDEQITTVKDAIDIYNQNLKSWNTATQNYESQNGKDTFSSQSAEDVQKAETEYDAALYDTLDVFVIGMWDEFDELYTKLTESTNFVYGTKRIDQIKTAQDLKDALTGTSFSNIVTVQEATEKLQTLYHAETVEYDPHAINQAHDNPENEIKQLCFLTETIVPIQALRYLNSMYPPEDAQLTEQETKDQNSTKTDYENAKNQMTGKSGSTEGGGESGQNPPEESKADFGYTFKNQKMLGGLPSSKAETEKKTQAEDKFKLKETGEGDESRLDASSSLKSQSSKSNSVLENIGKTAVTAVENLYVLNYVFENFSHNTILQEQILEDNKVKSTTSIAQIAEAEAFFNDAEKVNAAKEKSITLSSYPINPYNNYLYGGEIEYILFGNNSPSANVTTAKASIYAIRFTFNCIFAFTDSEIRNSTMAAGLAVQAATLGVVPYQVVQIVLQLALAAAESAVDLSVMNYGLPVAVIKTKDTWSLSMSGGANILKDAANAAATSLSNKVTGYAEKAISKVTNGLNGVLDASADKLKTELAGLSSNMADAAEGVLESVADKVYADVTAQIESALNDLLNTRTGQTTEDKKNDILPTKAEVRAKAVTLFDTISGKVGTIVGNACGGNVMAEKLAGTLTSKSNTMIAGMKEKVLAAIDSTPDEKDVIAVLSEEMNGLKQDMVSLGVDFIDGLAVQISNAAADAVDQTNAQIQGYINQCGDELTEEAAKLIKEEVKGLTDSFVDTTMKLSGSTSSATDVKTSPMAMFKFGYKDYLMLLTYISICAGDSVLLRTADVIQMNFQSLTEGSSSYTHKANTDGSKFLMDKAYTYISISADVNLEMFFMDMSLFRDQVAKDPGEESAEYEESAVTQGEDGSTKLTYKGLLGY